MVARAARGEPSFQLHASSSSAMAAARSASTPTAVSQSDRPAASTAYSPHPDGSARTSVAKAGVTPVLSSPEVRTATAGIHPDWLRMSSPAISTPTTGTDPAPGHLAEPGNRQTRQQDHERQLQDDGRDRHQRGQHPEPRAQDHQAGERQQGHRRGDTGESGAEQADRQPPRRHGDQREVLGSQQRRTAPYRSRYPAGQPQRVHHAEQVPEDGRAGTVQRGEHDGAHREAGAGHGPRYHPGATAARYRAPQQR